MSATVVPAKPLVFRLRVHLNRPDDCRCVRCEAADEIARLQEERDEAYRQIDYLLSQQL